MKILDFFLLHQNNIHYERTDVQLGIFSLPLTQSLDKQMRKSFLRVNDANAKLMEHEVSHSRFSEVGGQKVTQSGDRSPRRSPIHGLSLLWSARGYSRKRRFRAEPSHSSWTVFVTWQAVSTPKFVHIRKCPPPL